MNRPSADSVIEILTYFNERIAVAAKNDHYMLVENLIPVQNRLLELLRQISEDRQKELYADYENAMEDMEEEDE